MLLWYEKSIEIPETSLDEAKSLSATGVELPYNGITN